MSDNSERWRPSCDRETAVNRSKLLNQVNEYFTQTGALSVETPALSKFSATDVQLTQWQTLEGYQLHTSPEFAMKRLLCAGYGDIYQLCRVFRQDELGVRHNPEFTMLEWYRIDFDEYKLMDDVVALIQSLKPNSILERELWSYQEAFVRFGLPDPHVASTEALQVVVNEKLSADTRNWSRDECLDALMAMVVEPALPKNKLCFIHDYPASQAALAEIHQVNGTSVAKRFELYWQGMELANGYSELTDVAEQRRRFEQDLSVQQENLNIDENFLAALAAGLPKCAGVALGVDRLMMILLEKKHIEEVITFAFSRA